MGITDHDDGRAARHCRHAVDKHSALAVDRLADELDAFVEARQEIGFGNVGDRDAKVVRDARRLLYVAQVMARRQEKVSDRGFLAREC